MKKPWAKPLLPHNDRRSMNSNWQVLYWRAQNHTNCNAPHKCADAMEKVMELGALCE